MIEMKMSGDRVVIGCYWLLLLMLLFGCQGRNGKGKTPWGDMPCLLKCLRHLNLT